MSFLSQWGVSSPSRAFRWALIGVLFSQGLAWADDAANEPTEELLPRVHVIATGGTIAGTGYEGVDVREGTDLLLGVPELADVARVTSDDPITIGSSQLTPEIIFDIAQQIRKVLAEDAELAGVVVTQGTDSMEESAFLADLVIDDPRPVVFTGAMRQPGQMAAEGGRNLLNAVRLAASPEMRGLGVLVTMNDEIHAARELRKTDSSAIDAFESAAGGALGFIDGDAIYMRSVPRHRTMVITDSIQPKVDLLAVTVGTDGHMILGALEGQPKGLVIELFGRGNFPNKMVPAIVQALRQGVKIVFVSRTHRGGMREIPQWVQGGVVYAENLDGLKARVALMVALGAGKTDSGELQEFFDDLAGRL